MVGETFRKMRRSRKITLETAAQGIISVSTLSRFERGDLDVHVNQLIRLLKRVGSNITEFANLIEQQDSTVGTFEEKIMRLYRNGHTAQLAAIVLKFLNEYRQNHAISELFAAGTAANCYFDLTAHRLLNQNEVDDISDAISDITKWDLTNIRRLGNVSMIIQRNLLLGQAIKLVNNLESLSRNNHMSYVEAWEALFNIVYTLLIKKDVDGASKILQLLRKQHLRMGSLLIKTRLYLMLLLLDRATHKDVEEKISQLVQLIKLVDDEALAVNFEAAYKTIEEYYP